ncbi:DUF4334 domain-containing protein [Nocardioides humilatus]|uniref:DUF4334 domain-containing protein n=1 Tax=Nocardioides humilatus TaxID=2607660 RepID=A0A5B1L7Y1_9ACTN|nr:DUF4334 domain-containing protein [Nocardioides humilatus]KAA1416831.1 DUF4334 domain-containing protein [Nocardioides humilatus]
MTTTTEATAQLAALELSATPESALALFDSLPAVACSEMSGRYRGRELFTGHPMDGLLAASGWYGKQFDDVDHVHPLLFKSPGGDIFPVEPRKMPLGVAAKVPAKAVSKAHTTVGVLKPAIRTKKHRARLRAVDYRGVVSAAMVYDHLPIIDVFRRVDADTLLGVMDLRGSTPYVFILEKDGE